VGGTSVGIGLPIAAYEDFSEGVSVAAQALEDRGARMVLTIESASAPTEFRFPIAVPSGGRLEAQVDGTVNVIDAAGLPAGHFAAPWAIDAVGSAVPTSYRVAGNVLVQTVQHTDNYPVLADPHYDWGWVTGTAYFNRKETRSMKTLSYGATVAGGLCAAFAAQTLGAACAVSAAFYAQWNYVAGNAYADGGCIKIKVPPFWASAYAGGRCR
jgi:hypothetical protein